MAVIAEKMHSCRACPTLATSSLSLLNRRGGASQSESNNGHRRRRVKPQERAAYALGARCRHMLLK